MEKILLVVNNRQINKKAVDFACYLALLTHSKLTGFFIEDLLVNATDQQVYENAIWKKPMMYAVKEQDSPAISITRAEEKSHIIAFKQLCEQKGVAYEVYEDKGAPIDEVVYESRFTDFIILDPQLTFNQRLESLPTYFVRKVMAEAECPVIVCPEDFEDVNEIVFCYDESKSAVHAMKQFTYLFPQYQSKPVVVLEVKTAIHSQPEENHSKIISWLKMHYSQIDFNILKGEAKDELPKYLLAKKNLFVVMGAYGRNIVSTFFKRSSADVVLQAVDQPLFIAHS